MAKQKSISQKAQGESKQSRRRATTHSSTGSKNHHYTHPILTHDWSFLQGDKKHTHTLKAGFHSFPFNLMLHGNLPSTIRSYNGDAGIAYKLHATVVRSGFASNFHSVKHFTLQRTYTSDALEFNQTLEIENTWPGKVMYALTLPFKAYAAGDDIPVNVKFMPLAKGVRVTSVTSVIKEYSLVHTRHSNHPDQRVAASVKHELRHGRAVLVTEEAIRPPSHWQDRTTPTSHSPASRTPLAHPSHAASRVAGYFGGASASAGSSVNGRSNAAGSSSAAASRSNNATASSSAAASTRSSNSVESGTEEDMEIGDDEINTQFTIPIPPWTTPSHSVHPVFITHKIKWSCSISNADGHVSELRCALPIAILDHSLLEEARASGASTRGLLFGGSGEETQQVDLPSYSNHVYDRVAFADSGNTSGFVPRSLSTVSSPHATPPGSRAPSRPGSPTGPRPVELNDDLPPRRELSSWADSELLLSLGSLRVHSGGSSPNDTPPMSRGPSRPLSRRNSRSGRSSRVGSRAGSRASSPERGPNAHANDERPQGERRNTGGLSGLLHLSNLKHRPQIGSKPILRNASHAGLIASNHEGVNRNSLSFTNLQDHRQGHEARRGVSFANSPARPRFHMEDGTTASPDELEDDTDPINRVPSYAIASRGFLGGGVVPIDGALPTYDASERSSTTVSRSHRSDTALVDMGAEAHAAAETRAADDD